MGPGSHRPPCAEQVACGFTPGFSPQDRGPRGRGLGLVLLCPGPKAYAHQEQVPSENPSSVEISISIGSQEVPHRSDSPFCVMSATQCSNRCWEGLAEGRTDGRRSSISRQGRPTMVSVYTRPCSLSSCALLSTCTPFLGSPQNPSGAAALQMRRQNL